MTTATPVPANLSLRPTISSGTQASRTYSTLIPSYTPLAPILKKRTIKEPDRIAFNNENDIRLNKVKNSGTAKIWKGLKNADDNVKNEDYEFYAHQLG